MNEADALELVAIYGANGLTSFTMYVTFTTAFLVATYLIGARLTGKQAIALCGLYIFSALGVLGTLTANILVWIAVSASTRTVLDDIPLMSGQLWITYSVVSMGMGILISLFYMWSVWSTKSD